MEDRTKLQESETWRDYVPECTAKNNKREHVQSKSHREQVQNTLKYRGKQCGTCRCLICILLTVLPIRPELCLQCQCVQCKNYTSQPSLKGSGWLTSHKWQSVGEFWESYTFLIQAMSLSPCCFLFLPAWNDDVILELQQPPCDHEEKAAALTSLDHQATTHLDLFHEKK